MSPVCLFLLFFGVVCIFFVCLVFCYVLLLLCVVFLFVWEYEFFEVFMGLFI